MILCLDTVSLCCTVSVTSSICESAVCRSLWHVELSRDVKAETLSALGTVSQQLREETASLLSRAVEQVRGMHLAQSDDTPCHELHQRVDALALTFSELVAAHQARRRVVATLRRNA